eukprot:gene12286-6993_t
MGKTHFGLLVFAVASNGMNVAETVAVGDYKEYSGLNCYQNHGGINIDTGRSHPTNLTLPQCKALCDETKGCYCVVAAPEALSCFRRANCLPSKCDVDRNKKTRFNAYIKPGGPPVPPPSPSPPPPPTPPPHPIPPHPPHPPAAGPPCTDCPNILFMFTDDQDEIIGGWEPMEQTRKVVGERGATATDWRIHTPICAASRSELQSGSSGAITHVDLGNKVWPFVFPKMLREEKGYATALFGKCMNGDCGYNPQDGVFYDNEAKDCAGYLTSELGNRTIAWIQDQAAVAKETGVRRPWFVYYATHAPHGPYTPAPWYSDSCPGVTSPRTPNFNYTGRKTTSCTLFPPSQNQSFNHFTTNGTRLWWNGTDFPELTSCQPPINQADAADIDNAARRRCQCLKSVDDSYVAIINAIEELGELANTYTIISSDHGYNLGHHMLVSAKMQIYEHSLRIPT